jgi:hypothetical protein
LEEHKVKEVKATMPTYYKNTRDSNLAMLLASKPTVSPVTTHTHVLIRSRAIVVMHIILMPTVGMGLLTRVIILRCFCLVSGQLLTADVAGVQVVGDPVATKIQTIMKMIRMTTTTKKIAILPKRKLLFNSLIVLL